LFQYFDEEDGTGSDVPLDSEGNFSGYENNQENYQEAVEFMDKVASGGHTTATSASGGHTSASKSVTKSYFPLKVSEGSSINMIHFKMHYYKNDFIFSLRINLLRKH